MDVYQKRAFEGTLGWGLGPAPEKVIDPNILAEWKYFVGGPSLSPGENVVVSLNRSILHLVVPALSEAVEELACD